MWSRVSDVLVSCVEFLPLQDLPSVLLVSRTWYIPLSTSQRIWAPLYTERLDPSWLTILPGFHRQVAQAMHMADIADVIARGVATTSTDHVTQSLANTLHLNPVSFWSSAACLTKEGHQSVLYEVAGPTGSLIHTITLRFYQELRQSSFPKYTTRRVQVRCGYGDVSDIEPCETTGDRRMADVAPRIVWTYESSFYEAAHTIELQRFVLPKAVPAQFVQIVFEGPRTQQSDADDLFYVCLNRVHILGSTVVSLPEVLREALSTWSKHLTRPCLLPPVLYEGPRDPPWEELHEYERLVRIFNELIGVGMVSVDMRDRLRDITRQMSRWMDKFELAWRIT